MAILVVLFFMLVGGLGILCSTCAGSQEEREVIHYTIQEPGVTVRTSSLGQTYHSIDEDTPDVEENGFSNERRIMDERSSDGNSTDNDNSNSRGSFLRSNIEMKSFSPIGLSNAISAASSPKHSPTSFTKFSSTKRTSSSSKTPILSLPKRDSSASSLPSPSSLQSLSS